MERPDELFDARTETNIPTAAWNFCGIENGVASAIYVLKMGIFIYS